MIDKRLTFSYYGREALPVRAIPYVTGWDRFTPVALVRYLAQVPERFTELSKPLTAYVMRDGKPVVVPVDAWDRVLRILESFEAQAGPVTDPSGDAAWLEHAAEKLPAGVFVWSDEFRQIIGGTAHALPAGFEAKWQEAFGESYSDTYEKPWQDDRKYAEQGWGRPTPHDDGALVLDPLLMDDATRAMVMEGFADVGSVPVAEAEKATTPTTATTRRGRKPPWHVVAMPYMKALFKRGSFKSAKHFHSALLVHAGEPDSPFTKAGGHLFCTDAGTQVSDGTVGTKWAEIRGT
jgi:hypothetical protein